MRMICALLAAILIAASLQGQFALANNGDDRVFRTNISTSFMGASLSVRDDNSFFVLDTGKLHLYQYDGNLVYRINTGKYNGGDLKLIQSVTVDGKSYFIADGSPHLYTLNSELSLEVIYTFNKYMDSRYLVKVGDSRFAYVCYDDIVLFDSGDFVRNFSSYPLDGKGNISQVVVSGDGFVAKTEDSTVFMRNAYNFLPSKFHIIEGVADIRSLHSSEEGDLFMFHVLDTLVIDDTSPIDNRTIISGGILSSDLVYAHALSNRSALVLTDEGSLFKLSGGGAVEWELDGFSTKFAPLKYPGGLLLKENNNLVFVSNSGEKQTKISEKFKFDEVHSLLLNQDTLVVINEEGIISIEYFKETDIRQLKSYNDVSVDAWYSNFIQWSLANSITSGYPDNTFRPSGYITEAEILSILVRMYVKEVDITQGDKWYDGYYNIAEDHNWKSLKGLSDDSAKNNSISRGDLARLVLNASGHIYSTDKSIQYLLDNNISSGKTSKTISGYKAGDKLTRAEAVKFLYAVKHALESLKLAV